MKRRQSSPLERAYRLKLSAFGACLIVVGLLLDAAGDWLEGQLRAHLLVSVVQSLADVLIVTGGIGLAIDYFAGRDKAEADVERTRGVVRELAPEFTDAVLRGLAVDQDDLRRVASPQLLDDIATNALAVRLGDEHFAAQIYQGLLTQAVYTPERWKDVDIDVRLFCLREEVDSRVGPLDPQALFGAIITWEYTVTLGDRVRRFVATDDEAEFREFLNDGPATSAWFIPRGYANPANRTSFEVLSYSVDGTELPIRRTAHEQGQTFSIDVGAEVIAAQRPVRVRQVYRTVVPRIGHRFRVSLTQPTHGLRLVLDYTDADIASLMVGELVSSVVPAQVKFLPPSAPARLVEVSVPGWLLPQAEITCVWTLEDEVPTGGLSVADTPAGSPAK